MVFRSRYVGTFKGKEIIITMVPSIPLNTVPLVKVAMPPAEILIPKLEKVLYSGMIAEGEAVYNFEKRFSEQFGLPNALAMSSGTAALHIALLLAGAGPGREVITTSMTAEPTNTCILHTGATPVFADVDDSTGNLFCDAVAAAVTNRTSAIVVVHYAGYPADLTSLRNIADQHGICLIEDCAHALGAFYGDAHVGNIGDSAIFSFQAIKHMTTVDGGMLVLRDPTQIDAARRLRWFGLPKGVPRTRADMTTPGFKYNMNNVAATIGLVQLEFIEALLDQHRDNGQFYDASLQRIPGISPAPVLNHARPSYWLYTLLADDSADIERALSEVGVAASKLHRPNHLHSAFSPYAGYMPRLERFYQRLVHIPCGWWVDSASRELIVATLSRG